MVPPPTTPRGLKRPSPARMDRLLATFHTVIPTEAFVRLFKRSGSFVRKRKQSIGVTGVAMRLDSFARLKCLPKLPGMRAEEREVVREFWEDLRITYGRGARVRRMRPVILQLSGTLPSTAIAQLFGVSRGLVVQYQHQLGVQNTKLEADRLRAEFLKAPTAPSPAGLTADELTALASIWQSMREKSGMTKYERETWLLRLLTGRVPTSVLALMLGIESAAICCRRRTAGIVPTRGVELMMQLLRESSPPFVSQLEDHERRALNSAWRTARTAALQARAERVVELDKALIEHLKKRKRALRSRPQVRCRHAGCTFRWPRTPEFFHRERSSPDGLSGICKICAARQRRNPNKMRRAPARRVLGGERRHIRSVIRQNARVIPSRTLQRLFNISAHHVGYLRAEVGVKLTSAQSWYVFQRWVLADTFPRVLGLRGEELERLRVIWREEKEAYAAQLLEDDGLLSLQREARAACLRETPEVTEVPCCGPHCRGDVLWPQRGDFFRRHTRCRPEERLCHACANAVTRLQRAAERK